ncbi:MAG: hydantoinase B/oxoprolinase family protein [Candidatus Binatia bacterium]|jgi:N-methylhydantoinase B|nr:hydantoinase B/oxoprolinase family protein [Candidatus Binatia bacterium]
MIKVDPITLQVIQARLAGIVQEMQNSLFRTGFSTIIRESQDASCAILNREGQVVAQHVVLPLHMGAFPACAEGLLKQYAVSEIHEGDAFITNHPYLGGSPHAPDMAVLSPIFFKEDLVGFSTTMAHKSDIGGPVPGSCWSRAQEIFQEGLHLPPVKYISRFRASRDIEEIIGANSRTPELVVGDIRGQVGAARLGERRFSEVMEKYGKETVLNSYRTMFDLTETKVRNEIATWADGVGEGERFVDSDGIELDRPVRIHVRIEKNGDHLLFDFTGCANQTKGPANIRPTVVRAACSYCLTALVDPALSINQGLARVVKANFREGSVLNPYFPAPVNTYNPTVHALVESLFEALSQLTPTKKIADGCASRSIIIGGRSNKTGRSYVQYEIFGGGSGARSGKDGVSGTTINHSNARIAPLEIIESEFSTRIHRFELITDSGGGGEFRGGLGFVREYELLEQEARFSLRSTKHVIAPKGVDGGLTGRTGKGTLNPRKPDEKVVPSRCSDLPLRPGNVFRLETPGGGGLGNPLERDPQKVLKDVKNGYVSLDKASTVYGVVIEQINGNLFLDEPMTEKTRETLAS